MKKNKPILKLTIRNTESGKCGVVHFPVNTPTRQKYLNALDLKEDNYIIMEADFPNTKVNDVLTSLTANLSEISYFSHLYAYVLDESARRLFDVLVTCEKIRLSNTRDLISGIFALNDYYSIRGADTPEKVGRFFLLLARETTRHFEGRIFTKKECTDVGKAIIRNESGWFYKGVYYGKCKTNKSKLVEYKEYTIPDGFLIV